MAAISVGPIGWQRDDDKEGHRTYTVRHLVKTDSVADGPQIVAGAAGLYAVGSPWSIGNDYDAWALCWPTLNVRSIVRKEPGYWWIVGQRFSTKPLDRCQDTTIENPLAEPQKVSGSFTKYTKEVDTDRHGDPIRSSSHERFRAAAMEFDDNRPAVSITSNLATLPLSTFAPMVDTVNDADLWGLGPRKIKLSAASWERVLWGVCTYYYTVTYEFDVDDSEEGFDRWVYDEGTKVLIDGGDPANPEHFEVRKGLVAGENFNGRFFLNGAGKVVASKDDAERRTIEYYKESNFLLLGIPIGF